MFDHILSCHLIQLVHLKAWKALRIFHNILSFPCNSVQGIFLSVSFFIQMPHHLRGKYDLGNLFKGEVSSNVNTETWVSIYSILLHMLWLGGIGIFRIQRAASFTTDWNISERAPLSVPLLLSGGQVRRRIKMGRWHCTMSPHKFGGPPGAPPPLSIPELT